ncbi:hypothetical protein OSB04_022454 [Centaurea solstitialis]|uniref:Late embryogenesis abundant protein LEA-2 subgroup domain-containing protein n=1 Tax=Centaurea solstitialis TaxID=347529 RepID=A0AA38T7H4_9ASTR|nr:hypothetical protein OSB04_022454 [Centaurea solstitialis]
MSHGVCLESLKIMVYITGFSILLIIFIQSLHRKNPTISIEAVYVPSLDKNVTTTTAATTAAATTAIYFDLKIYNTNVVGLYYRPMNLTFSYYPNKKTTNVSVPFGVYPIRGFHQGHYKERRISDKVVVGGMAVQPDGRRVVVIRLDLVGRVKFKSIAQWKRTVVVGVDVEVNGDTGEMVNKTGGMKLVRHSGAPAAAVVGGWICPAMLLIFSSFFNLKLL